MQGTDLANSLDLARHVNTDTGELGDVLTAALADELGPERYQEAQDLAMACLARAVEHFDGRRLYITQLQTALDGIQEDRALSMLADGKSVRQVTARTGLSEYKARKVQGRLEETCGAGVLGAQVARA